MLCETSDVWLAEQTGRPSLSRWTSSLEDEILEGQFLDEQNGNIIPSAGSGKQGRRLR